MRIEGAFWDDHGKRCLQRLQLSQRWSQGAVVVSFLLFGTSFMFVNSHLTAHTENVKVIVTTSWSQSWSYWWYDHWSLITDGMIIDQMIFPNTGSSKGLEEDLCNAQSPQAPALEAETWHIWQVRAGFFAPPTTAPFRAGTSTFVICNFSYDCVFWCGDLNFRLEQTRAEIIRYLTCLFVLSHRRNISIPSF